MKRNLIYLMGVLIISVASCSFTNKTFDNPDKDAVLVELISYVLERGHFDPKDINDNFSENVYYDYLDAIDPLKRFFLASDIKEFEKYKYDLDDQIKNSNITFFNLTYDRFMKRIKESVELYKEVLNSSFDYTVDETIDVDYEKLPYAKSKKEMVERWRKQLKFSAISNYASKIEDEERKAKDDPDYKKKAIVDIEKEVRASILETYNEYFDFVNDLERKDWFSQYLNAIVEEFDPHTFYFAPDDKDRFDTSMSGKYEGIGARLQKKSDHIRITEVISGGPAWRDQKLDVGDEILKVGQAEEEPVDIVGMRLDDAIKLIKGPKGTEVRLTIRRVDGTIEVVPIVRDIIELEESYAKSSIVKKGERTFGIINLPKFYIDFDDYKERNAASDVAKEIGRLKQEGIEGLVLDLRDNGGGSLKTVVDMAGLFIKDGPIVQVKSTGQRKEVLSDKDKTIQWDGPLVILVNELSASASEILAAAMQDYKRAIVLGSKQTYGKGTVQNIVDLNQFLRNNNDYGDVGALKLTTQKFYRINGGSTQLEGVKSDVIVPDRYSYIDIGEKDQENPLPWDKIDPAYYEVWDGYIDYEETIKKSKERMANNPQIGLIDENAKWIKKQQDDKEYPLSYDAYKKQLEADDERAAYFKKIADYKTDLTFNSLPYEKELFLKDTVLKKKRMRWQENMSKDVYIEEALNVLEDLKLSNIKRGKVAGIKG
ncbi:carboxy terminal-processing peptidase [Leptobacterium sp. I13]|uniref:carboxy terminal-processing peptidase n=1 Tax=Leptobacterium meishanense TaxID=3128904 RepID=UPI0030EC29BA